MKRLLITLVGLMSVARFAQAQPVDTYFNSATITYPGNPLPAVDATNFINTGNITLNLGTQLPYSFADVLNYTNRGTFKCDSGFVFDLSPYNSGFSYRSALFGNANVGTIDSTGYLTELTVKATNIVNAGVLHTSYGGLISLDGDTIDITRGSLKMDGTQTTGSSSLGLALGLSYWGLGSQTNAIGQGKYDLTKPVVSPGYLITNAIGAKGFFRSGFLLQNPQGFANVVVTAVGTNVNTITQVILIGNSDTNHVTVSGLFGPDTTRGNSGALVPIAQYSFRATNNAGVIYSNVIALGDNFGVDTNLLLQTNNFGYIVATNYTNFSLTAPLTTNSPGGYAVGNTPYDKSLVPKLPETNDFTATGLELFSYFGSIDTTIGQSFANLPGRVEINADKSLDLSRTVIDGPTYINITSTNQFKGSGGASISAIALDLNLGSTNGSLTVSNLVAPTIPRFSGNVDVYSARWTVVDTNANTNFFQVFMLGGSFGSSVAPLVQNLQLASTNVVISDSLTVLSNVFISSSNLTIISSNTSSLSAPYGAVTLLSPFVTWENSFPILNNLTNFGSLSSSNGGIYFGRFDYTNLLNPSNHIAYGNVVNSGVITAKGLTFFATNFVNGGVPSVVTNFYSNTSANSNATVYSSGGAVNIMASNATLTNGSIFSPDSDINISVGNLSVQGHSIYTPTSLSLSITNQVSDGGLSASNNWYTQGGFNLYVKPASGGLFGTTVSNFCPSAYEIINTWAGLDYGANIAGYQNNGAIGHLILDSPNVLSTFGYAGLDSHHKYAIYVDKLELQDAMTNFSGTGASAQHGGFDIPSNFTIYYADCVSGSTDVSATLNGANGGRIRWVSNYAGLFSSTNITFTNGSHYVVNRPYYLSQGNAGLNLTNLLNLNIKTVNLPPIVPVVTWDIYSTNSKYALLYKSNILGTNWTVLISNIMVTNLTSPTNYNYIDTVHTNGTGYYKVLFTP